LPNLLWDASALVKTLIEEPGSQVAETILQTIVAEHLLTFLGYAEVSAVLSRQRNGGRLSLRDFHEARAMLYWEVFGAEHIQLLSIEDSSFIAGVSLTDRHNINSADAAVLQTYLLYSRLQPSLLVASDRRLIRAAEAEGLPCLDPERISPDDLGQLLAGG
jgi:predicted nucleic acid-binding protein